MSNFFNQFAENSDNTPMNDISQNTANEKTAWEKKIERQVKKNNKLLKKILKQEKRMAKTPQPTTSSFLKQAEEAAKKAMPVLLSFIPSIIKGLFSRRATYRHSYCF